MSTHVFLNLLNELRKRDKMGGLPRLFRNKFNKFNCSKARMFDSIYDIKITLKSHFWRKTLYFCHRLRNVIMFIITFPENL